MSWSLRIIAVVLAFTASAAAAQDATTTAITHASSRGVPSSLLVLQGHWVLDELASGLVKPSISGIIPWFTVENQKIQGYDGCNEFYGDLDISGSIITTRRGCPDRVPIHHFFIA